MSAVVAHTRAVQDVDRAIAARIREFRALAGISQEKLGEGLGITFQQVQKYEKGLNRVSAGRLLQIADLLGQPIAAFFDAAPASEEVDAAALQFARRLSAVAADRRPGVYRSVTAILEAVEG